MPSKGHFESSILAEKVWHDKHFSGKKITGPIPQDIRDRYLKPSRRPLFELERMMELVGDVAGRKILCYGCGDSNISALLALKGAQVWPMDISDVAIDSQRMIAAFNCVTDSVHPTIGAAESLPFRDGIFDIVFGTMVLHHLPDALDITSKEIRRVLKQTGFGLFSEPVLRSKAIEKIRKLFPERDISPRERQLNDSDFAKFQEDFHCRREDFYILSRFNALLLRQPLETAPILIRAVVMMMVRTDKIILKLPLLRRFASTSIVMLVPKHLS